MRVNRAKLVRRWLRFYRIVYGIAPPYAILLDGNFIHMALKVKMDIKDRLKKVLLGEPFACYVPRAVLDELTALGPAFQPALQYAQACCEVLEKLPAAASGEEEMSAGTAIRALVGDDNKGKYMVATQDQDLKAELRHVPSVGLLFVSRAVLLMEPPSNTSKAVSAKQEDSKFRLLSEEERALLTSIKKVKKKESAASEPQQQQHESAAAQKVRLKKKAKGPNPLSVKKSDKTKTKKKGTPDKKTMAPPKKQKKSPSGPKPTPPAGGGGGEGGKKRKRKQKKKKKAEGAAASP